MPGFLPNIFPEKNDGPVIFRDIFFKNPVGMCILTHPDFRIKLVNESFARIFSLEKSNVTGDLFSVVWEKSASRDEFFTALRKEGHVDDFSFSRPVLGGGNVEIIISAVFIDSENILISAVIRSG